MGWDGIEWNGMEWSGMELEIESKNIKSSGVYIIHFSSSEIHF